MQELEEKNGVDGHSLDEFQAHRFLEANGQALTVVEMRKALKEIDIDTDNRMSLLEYVVHKFKLDVDVLMTRPQGTNEELKKAQAALDDADKEIKRIEKQKTELEAKSEKPGVAGLQAKAELAQLLNSDQLPLRKLLLTAQADVRKAQKDKNMAAQGTLWWLQREIDEAMKYKPQGGLKKKTIKTIKQIFHINYYCLRLLRIRIEIIKQKKRIYFVLMLLSLSLLYYCNFVCFVFLFLN